VAPTDWRRRGGWNPQGRRIAALERVVPAKELNHCARFKSRSAACTVVDQVDLTDAIWAKLQGGYRVPYDPRPALGRLEAGNEIPAAWAELWEELFQQGDVGEASYAAVPELVRVHRARGFADWNTYALVGTIELARDAERNPQLPAWLERSYQSAWDTLQRSAFEELPGATDDSLVRSILGFVALAKDQRNHGRLLLEFTSDEIEELIDTTT
jgi:hypothetical protein